MLLKKKRSNLGIRSQAFPLLEFSPALESWSNIYTGSTSCLIITPCLHRTRARQKTIELIIISDAVYTGCRAATQQIPDSKLLPRSIYDLLTQISNDFQRSHCHVQCRQNCLVETRFKPSFVPQMFSSFVYIRHLYLSVVVRLMSVMCTDERSLLLIMSRHAPYCWLAKSLFWYWAWLSFLKHLKKCILHL